MYASPFSILVLFATLGFALWGGFVLGPKRVLPLLLVLGPLFLPAHASVDLPGLPELDRLTVIAFPALVLFALASLDGWRRFRPILPDLLLVAFIAWTAICTAANQGSHAAVSMALKQALRLGVPYLAGRLYLQRPADLVRLARFVAPLLCIYLPLMAFEARFYPRFQRMAYGEEILGLARGSLYRPVMFAQNALELGHLLVLLTLLLLALHRSGEEARKASGRLLSIGVVAGCMGVCLSFSRGPVTALLLAGLLPLLLRRTAGLSTLLGAGGVAFFLWMLSPQGSAGLAALAFADESSETGQTLFFRFLQIEAFKPMIEQSWILGYGESWEREEMKIIDGELLLTVLGFGYPGVLLLALFWLSCLWTIGRRCFPREGPFQHLAAGLAPVLGWLVFSAWGDSFLRAPHYVVIGGLLSALAGFRRESAAESLAANPIRRVELRWG